MALVDSRKRVVAVSYGDAISGTPAADCIHNTSTGVRVAPKTASGSFKCLNGGMGAKVTWRNVDDTTAEVTAECYVEANDTTGAALETLPDWSEMYEICGMTETVDVGTPGQETVTYTPSGTQPSDASQLAVWVDGTKRVLTGIIGDLTISGTVGEPIKQSAKVMGYTTVTSTTEANPAGTCVTSAALIILKSTDTFTIGGTAYKMQSFTFNQGNQVEKYYAINTKEYELNDFDSTLEVTFLKENETLYTTYEAGTSVAVVLQAGSADGKAINITAAQAVIEDAPTEGSDKDKETVTVKFSLLPSTATAYDNYAIKYGYLAI